MDRNRKVIKSLKKLQKMLTLPGRIHWGRVFPSSGKWIMCKGPVYVWMLTICINIFCFIFLLAMRYSKKKKKNQFFFYCECAVRKNFLKNFFA
ncbi:hypothetical protein GDO81_011044 [Engystomops pustulosus]|uniref:Uncharacterized protein n=1 Tax=Engystomops pustulosus TaxID=76066 RepID=A0AAV7C479_ENGPU|nr:hypothetical protein GDO81_011044 [Engystomops pustulosus]